MKEIWKDIPEYEGLYQVSNLGRIKSLPRYKTLYSKKVFIKGCIRKFGRDKDGYYIIPLNKNGIKKMYRVHRIVAEVFIPNIHNKPVIDHIDCDITNNNVNNLRWVTVKENNNYIIENGHAKRDELGRFVSYRGQHN